MKNNLVRKGYNRIAENYSKQRNEFKNNRYLEHVLDVGCDSGIPVDKYLVDKGFKIIGFDISRKQIQLAKQNLPQAIFEVKDMFKLKEGEYKVDAVVSFYAIFHTPREKHQELLTVRP